MRSVTFATPLSSALCAESLSHNTPTFSLLLYSTLRSLFSTLRVHFPAHIHPPWSAEIPSSKPAQMSRSVQSTPCRICPSLSPHHTHRTTVTIQSPQPKAIAIYTNQDSSSTRTGSKKKPPAPKQPTNPKKPKPTGP